MKFGTLDNIIDDILLEYNNSNISESQPISRNQIEQWILQYRSTLIKQDIDKGRNINEDYVQHMNMIPLVLSSNPVIDKFYLKTSISIPRTIDFHFKSGIVYVSDLYGNEIQLMSEKRSELQKERRCTSVDYTCYKKDGFVYVNGDMEIEAINISLIAQNPFDVQGFSIDDEYPIPANMIPTLKELIFKKELNRGIEDNTNNTSYDKEGIQKQ